MTTMICLGGNLQYIPLKAYGKLWFCMSACGKNAHGFGCPQAEFVLMVNLAALQVQFSDALVKASLKNTEKAACLYFIWNRTCRTSRSCSKDDMCSVFMSGHRSYPTRGTTQKHSVYKEDL